MGKARKVMNTQGCRNVIRARKKGYLTMQQLREEIEDADRRQREDQNGILDQEQCDLEELKLLDGAVQPAMIW